MNPLIRSLYLHFPFCETKCHYCDFYSLAEKRVGVPEKQRFYSALFEEALLRHSALSPVLDTIFMGGGTPTLTPPSVMEEVFRPILGNHTLSQDYEWTTEGNPSSIDREKMERFRKLGVNRVSIGIQSLNNDYLVRFDRAHDEKVAHQAIESVFEAGFTNVSCDLLCGLPEQSLKDLDRSIDGLIQYPLTHLSIYLLTLTPTHRMAKDLPDENAQLEHLLHIDKRLVEAGFEHYEVSNFCKPAFQSRHNLNYWTGVPYLGLGPSAHSFEIENGVSKRSKNISSLHTYCEKLEGNALPTEWTETLTSEQLELEKWMLGLRLSSGVPVEWASTPAQKRGVERLMEEGLLEPHPEKTHFIRATPKGFSLLDSIIPQLAIY